MNYKKILNNLIGVHYNGKQKEDLINHYKDSKELDTSKFQTNNLEIVASLIKRFPEKKNELEKIKVYGNVASLMDRLQKIGFEGEIHTEREEDPYNYDFDYGYSYTHYLKITGLKK